MTNPEIKYVELGDYLYKLKNSIKMDVNLPNIVQDKDSLAYRYITLTEDGELRVYHDYCWNGSSVPGKKIWKRFGWNSDKYCKVASLVHDALCQLIRLGYLSMSYKEVVDELYRKMCIAGGMGKKQANIRYWFLRKFGDRYVKKERYPKRIIMEA